MRPHPALLLLPLTLALGADGEVRLGCGFGQGMGITDADSDGYGSTIDCDDDDPDIHPDADEYCDGVDNNCDDDIDEADAVDAETWYWDGDHDGWGAADGETSRACHQPDDYGPVGDCYDYDPGIRPDAEERCDGLDNDCDGVIDDDPVDALEGWLDQDADGFGDPEIFATGCTLPGGFVQDGGDCDDADAGIHPDADEICDELDNDCDGLVDPQSGDADGDGWDGCGGDCAPDDASVHPDADEVCGDGVDSDCDGSAGDCGLAGASVLGDHGLLLTSPTAYAAAGKGLAGVGDLDGDGLSDLAVGAPYADGASSNHGALYVIHGDAALRSDGERPLEGADLVIRGALESDMLGWSVAGAGDVDADGLGDLLIGAPWDAHAGFAAGAAYLVHGAVLDGLAGEYGVEELALRITAAAYDDQLGYALDGVGDVNGDGHDDLLIGAPQADGSAPSSGAAYLLLGPITADCDVTVADATWSSDTLNDGLGMAVAGIGDINADGLADAAIGAYRRDEPVTDAGVAAVVLGRVEPAGSWDLSDADAQLYATQTRAFAGCALAGVGDVDADGYDDLLVGARGQDYGFGDMGAAFLVRGPFEGADYLDAASDAAIRGDAEYGYAGTAVAGPGDIDGDGHTDLVLSAPYAGDDNNAGVVVVFYGPIEGVKALSDAQAVLQGGGSGHMLGERLSGAGDVDGDGYPDLLVGVPGYDQPSADAGAAWLLWGGVGL